jgi:hypothetical protein
VRIVDADREHEAAEQRRRDVVHVHRAARDRLALHRELEQLSSVERLSRPARCRRRPPPRPRPPSRRGPSRAGCPSRSSSRSRTAGRARAAGERTAMPAVFFSAASGRSATTPVMADRHASARAPVRRTRSPSAATVWPRMSKPMPTLPTLAGANAVARRANRRSQLRAEVRADAQQVGEHAGRRDLGPAPGPCTISGFWS